MYVHFISVFTKNEIKLIGDKNPHYASKIKKIFSLFPEGRYLHITRDYRDNILSNLKFEFGASKKSLLAYLWKESIIKINKLKTEYPDQFFTIKYEDLVDKPEIVMKDVCSFLDMEYFPEILSFHEKKDEVFNTYPPLLLDRILKFQADLFNPINKSAVGKWKTLLPENDIKLADFVVGNIAELSGYERKFKSFSLILFLKSYPLIGFYRIKQILKYLFKKYFRF